MKSLRSCLAVFFVGMVLASASSAYAKEQWIEVRSKNFHLIGNASEKDIRATAKRLEQFREAFRILFTKMNVTSVTPTTVVVFKDDGAYKPFKPRRADGKPDTGIAGYFQPGEDVNYITLAAGGDDEKFSTIFHEYVHFILNLNYGKSEIPAWFNEGLAEYYQTFAVQDDIKIRLGIFQQGHIPLLQQSELMPLSSLFNVSNRQLHAQGGHTRSIFYAQSWALVHYLQVNRPNTLGQFLSHLLRGVEPEKAFQEIFKMTYADMEKDLRKYISGNRYQYTEVTLANKMALDSEMTTSGLTEASANAYLGDLLYHTQRADDAEVFLNKSLQAEPENTLALTTLGMVKMRQRKFDEARATLEKAVNGDQKNPHALYTYAYVLSREGQDEFGYVRSLNEATAAKIRQALRRAISLNADFSPSYDLLAFVALVTNAELDDAASFMQKALKQQPGNQSFRLRLAELFVRLEKFTQASAIVDKIAADDDDPSIQQRAAILRNQIAQHAQYAEMRKKMEGAAAESGLTLRVSKPMTEADLKKRQDLAELRSMNGALRTPAANEVRRVGSVTKIDCKKKPFTYSIASSEGNLTLTSEDFNSLILSALEMGAADVTVGCDLNLSAYKAVITYKPRGPAGGEIVAIEFVPDRFRILSAEEMRTPDEPGVGVMTTPPPDFEERQRELIKESIKANLRQPAAGEKREIGILEGIECGSKAPVFRFNVGGQVVRLRNSRPESLAIRLFIPDLAGMSFGCELKPVEYPAVFVFADKPDGKTKSAGELIAIDFVPKGLSLN
jgi:tetratricopeptide (TPR) repeat protein